MPRKRDAIDQIIGLYSGLSPFDRGRLHQAMLAIDGPKPEPAKKLGRPAGSRNAPKVNGTVQLPEVSA